jgi:TonB family protein
MVAAGFLVAVVGSPQTAQERAGEAFRRGAELLDAGKGKPALKAFKEAIEEVKAISGHCSPCLLGLAASHSLLRQPVMAAGAAHQVIETTEDPQFLIPAYNYVGLSYFNRSVREVPRPWNHRALSDARNARFVENMKEAELAFRTALEMAPDRSESLRWNLATALEWLGREEEALPLFQPPDEEMAREQERLWAIAAAVLRKIRLRAGDPDADRQAPEDLRTLWVGKKISRPMKISDVQPQYTRLSSAARIEGRVRLRGILTPEGRVAQIQVLDGLTGLTAEAITAVRQWRYEPASYQGEPVPVVFNLTVNFQLRR